MAKSDALCPQQLDILSAGQMLKEAREKLNLTRAEVAEHIYLSTQTIIDLEKDYYTHLGAKVYIRGYLKNYARLVNIAPSTVLGAFEALYISQKPPLIKKPPLAATYNISHRLKTPTIRRIIKFIVIGLLGLSLLWLITWYGEKKLTSKKENPTSKNLVINSIQPFDSLQQS